MNVRLFARYAVRALLHRLRARRRRQQGAGLEDLFGSDPEPECPIPVPDCQNCRIDPAEVGRQQSRGAAILDTAAWLERGAWGGDERGSVQQYAAWLLKVRADYERGATRTEERI